MTEEVQFPNYQKPAGIPVADPKYSKHLFKLARMMMKPKIKSFPKKMTHKIHKKIKYL